jgi:flavin-dependent dehydrogenase
MLGPCDVHGVGRRDGWRPGDASMSFDPLSSQGIFNALYSGMKAGQALQHGTRGDFSFLSSYQQRLRKIYSIYLSNRNAYYSLERRWPNSRFWQRRTSEPAIA